MFNSTFFEAKAGVDSVEAATTPAPAATPAFVIKSLRFILKPLF